MKKIAVSIIIVAIVLTSLCSVAFGTYSKEITFRDIPYGTSFEETIDLLKQDGVIIDEPIGNISQSANEFKQYLNNRTTVAGYDMIISLYFADLESEENNWELEKSVFYKAEYQITNDDWIKIPGQLGKDGKAYVISTWYNDFVDKSNDLLYTLELLYGDSKLEDGSSGSFDPYNPGFAYREYSWNGIDGTVLNMDCYYYSDGSYEITIKYTDANIEETVTAQKTAAQEKANAIAEAERAKKQAEQDRERIEGANGL